MIKKNNTYNVYYEKHNERGTFKIKVQDMRDYTIVLEKNGLLKEYDVEIENVRKLYPQGSDVAYYEFYY